MTDSKQGPSAYKVQEDMLKRFPYNYYVTPLSSPPSAPQSTPTQRRYFYYDVPPPASIPTKATVLFLHGFPDCSYGWRNVLSSISLSGYRCIVPDLIGYGRSSKPKDLAYYGSHSQALDLAGLMTHVTGSVDSRFPVVGHDWGSWLAWRLAMWIPDRLLGVHGICVPYSPSTSKYMSVVDVANKYPMYGYQVFFDNPGSTAVIQDNLEAFLSLVYASPTLLQSNPELKKMNFDGWNQMDKILSSNPEVGKALSKASLLSEENSKILHLTFDEKAGGSIDGPLNWYRNRRVNFEEDKALTTKMLPKLPYKILVPELDPTAPMILAESAKRFMPAGSTYDIEVVKNCGHWVLIQYPELASQSILNWLEQKVLPGQASLLEKIRSKL